MSGTLSIEAQEDDESQAHSWAMFRGDARHSGCSPYNTTGNGGGVKWRYRHGDDFLSGCDSIAIGPDGTIYFGAWEPNGVFAIHPNGKEKWFLPLDNKEAIIRSSAPAVGMNGSIYIGAGNYLYSISQDGKIAWRFETDDYVMSPPTIAPNGTILFESYDYDHYAVSPNGKLIWNFTTHGVSEVIDTESSPAIGPDGTVYITGNYEGKNVIALHPNGTIKWILEIDNLFVESSVAIAKDGTIYCCGLYKNLYAINPNGTIKWIYPIIHEPLAPGLALYSHQAIGPDGTIYSGSINGLYAINPNGTLKWRANVNDTVFTPTVSADGTIFFLSNGVHAVNPDGSPKWVYDIDPPYITELVIGDDGTIYVYDQRELIALNGEPEDISPNLISPFLLVFPLIIIILVIGTLALLLFRRKRPNSR